MICLRRVPRSPGRRNKGLRAAVTAAISAVTPLKLAVRRGDRIAIGFESPNGAEALRRVVSRVTGSTPAPEKFWLRRPCPGPLSGRPSELDVPRAYVVISGGPDLAR